LLIAAWFFYMVFDAYTTAKARRYGLPIPDPIGLNAILEGDDGTVRQRVERAGERFGESVEQASQHFRHQWHQAGGATPHFPPGEAAPSDVGQANYNAAPGSIAPPEHERSPVGALVLIALGVLFLLSNLGWFSFFWIDRYWPVILIVTGLWLFIKRQRGTR
jgi:hypothetical protein